MAINILIISPNMPNVGCGLGDFSNMIVKGLKNHDTAVLAQNVAIPLKPNLRQSLIFIYRTWQIVNKKNIDMLIINYSAWGYQKHGLPLHIPLILLLVKNKLPITTFFHELWASTYAPRNSLLSKTIDWLQLILIKLTAACSSQIYTSTPEKASYLISKGITPNQIIVVPSNILRSDAERVLCNSPAFRLVIFGRKESREKAIIRNRSTIQLLQSMKKIETINIVGQWPENDTILLTELGISKENIVVHGFQDNHTISKILLNSDFILSPYDSHDLGKSGTIQAALSHGVIPVYTTNMVSTSLCPINSIHMTMADCIDRQRVEKIRHQLLRQSANDVDSEHSFESLLSRLRDREALPSLKK